MEHTELQRAAFKDAYAKRLRKHIFMIVLLFAVMAPLPFIEDDATFFGLPGAVLGPLFFVVIAVGWVIFEGRIWRCPACDKYLGRAFNPKNCPRCGIRTAWIAGGARPMRRSVRSRYQLPDSAVLRRVDR